MRRSDQSRRHRGFTLIELLVALAVFALMVIALLNLAGESVRTAVAVEERALAEGVAENQAVQAALLDVTQLGAPASGTEVAGERVWHWQRTAGEVETGLLRVEIRVRAEQGTQTLAERELLRAVLP